MIQNHLLPNVRLVCSPRALGTGPHGPSLGPRAHKRGQRKALQKGLGQTRPQGVRGGAPPSQRHLSPSLSLSRARLFFQQASQWVGCAGLGTAHAGQGKRDRKEGKGICIPVSWKVGEKMCVRVCVCVSRWPFRSPPSTGQGNQWSRDAGLAEKGSTQTQPTSFHLCCVLFQERLVSLCFGARPATNDKGTMQPRVAALFPHPPMRNAREAAARSPLKWCGCVAWDMAHPKNQPRTRAPRPNTRKPHKHTSHTRLVSRVSRPT